MKAVRLLKLGGSGQPMGLYLFDGKLTGVCPEGF